MNEVFRPAGNIRINTKNSYRKLNHPFKKKKKTTTAEPDKTTCFVLALLWTPEVLKKTENLNILPNIKQNTTI